MSKPEILEEKPITMAELKDELKKIKKRDEELNFRAEKTEEYLQQFTVLKNKESKDLYKNIEKLEIPRMKPEHIVKIIDMMPKTADEVKGVLQGYTITVSKDNLKRIADVIPQE